MAVVVTRRSPSGSQAWLSAPCWLTTMSGRNAAARARDEGLDGRQPGALAGERLERDVDNRPGRRPAARRAPLPGKRYRPGLVERDGQHAGVVGVDRLDPVAVVDVEIDVQDAQPGTAGGRAIGERHVVVDAEPRGPGGIA